MTTGRGQLLGKKLGARKQPLSVIITHTYTDAARYQSSYFGAHPFPSSVYFNCFGNESLLSSCQSTSSSSPCNSGYVAGVHCKGDVITGTLNNGMICRSAL